MIDMIATCELGPRERFTLKRDEHLTDEQCQLIADRFAAYRLPEREQVGNVSRDKALDPIPLVQTFGLRTSQQCVRVHFQRRVVRVGYRFENEVPDEQLNALCCKVVARNAGLTEDQIQTVIKVLDRKNPYRSAKYHIGPQLCGQLASWFDRQPNSHTVSYKVQNALISELRTLWYLDSEKSGDWYKSQWQKNNWPEPDGWSGWITGMCQVRCGVWYSASGGYDSWTGESDYEPAGLHPAYNQTLFKVELQGTRVHRWPWRDTWTDSSQAEYSYEVLVHPNDITLLDDGDRWER
jgi:hypothetical protein